MEKAINFLNQYYDKTMEWYQSLTQLEQLGVLYGLLFITFGTVAFYIIRK
jgi:hypothetical protein